MDTITPQEFEAMPVLLDVKQTAAVLRMHPRTVQIKARAGELPGRKIAEKWRFSKKDIAEWAGL